MASPKKNFEESVKKVIKTVVDPEFKKLNDRLGSLETIGEEMNGKLDKLLKSPSHKQ